MPAVKKRNLWLDYGCWRTSAVRESGARISHQQALIMKEIKHVLNKKMFLPACEDDYLKKKKIPLGRKNNGTLEKAAATAAGNGAQQRRAVRKTRTAAGNIPTISKKRKKSSRRTPGLSSYPVLIYLLSSYLYFCTYTEEYVHYMHTITLMPFSFYSLNYNSFRYATRGYSYSA